MNLFSSSIYNRLLAPANNNRLVVFRVLFGLVMAAECFGSVFTGRVNELFVDTPFNFSFIGFEWLAFLHGSWMNYYYCLMGMLGMMIAVGLYYRIASIGLAVLWTLTYLAEKTHYNNHYYLMVLLCWLMCVLPAHKRLSIDLKQRRTSPASTYYWWQHALIICQIWIVYTYAGIAKINPDWLQAMPLKLWMPGHAQTPLIGPLFTSAFAPWFMAYAGLLFDLLIVPALLWKRTRLFAFWVGVVFHLSNSVLFGIGTFPYLAIAMCVFFASSLWLDRKLPAVSFDTKPKKTRPWVIALAAVYLFVQMVLPIRHWFIPGNVNWTEEGHRMSWRMMLRTKNGGISFRVIDKQTGGETLDYPQQVLAREQFNDLCTHPDIIWQYAQYLKQKYRKAGVVVAVYADGCAMLNGKNCLPLVDPNVDLASVQWSTFGHNSWITSSY